MKYHSCMSIYTRFANQGRLAKLAILRKLMFLDSLSGSKTWDPASVAAGGTSATTTVTVTGAAVGDEADAEFSQVLPDRCYLTADVTAADTVTVSLVNYTGSAVDLRSGTLTARVEKNAADLAASL